MNIELDDYQKEAVNKLKTGSILCGGVGSGKSRTALAYFFMRVCGGQIKINGQGLDRKLQDKIPLYIITTARKRDSLDWIKEATPFLLEPIVDSWNNISKYVSVKDAFFIFDEQRVVGSGVWVKSFLKIAKNNKWILLSATPGDTWLDYVPVFIANGFYKNRTAFIRTHVVYSPHTNFPKVDKILGTAVLKKYRDSILVPMTYTKPTISHYKTIQTQYDTTTYEYIKEMRWNPYLNKPIDSLAELGYLLRRVCNSDISRLNALVDLLDKYDKIIIFYNFDYELDILRDFAKSISIHCTEWNGHLHQDTPTTDRWIYLIQYTAGSEAWECTTTNVILFWSQSYSYKITTQSAGRIDRRNTSYTDLYYYSFKSQAPIDKAISRAFSEKKNFNEAAYFKKLYSREDHML